MAAPPFKLHTDTYTKFYMPSKKRGSVFPNALLTSPSPIMPRKTSTLSGDTYRNAVVDHTARTPKSSQPLRLSSPFPSLRPGSAMVDDDPFLDTLESSQSEIDALGLFSSSSSSLAIQDDDSSESDVREQEELDDSTFIESLFSDKVYDRESLEDYLSLLLQSSLSSNEITNCIAEVSSRSISYLQTKEEAWNEYKALDAQRERDLSFKRRFQKLTALQEERAKKARAQYPAQEVLCKVGGNPITRHDMSTLAPCSWLNDEVINAYMKLMELRSKADPNMPKCHFFNTFFYKMLTTTGYRAVRTWTNKVDLFAQDKIIIPLHLGNHWALGVVDVKNKRFEYYDSLLYGRGGERILGLLRNYLEDEHKDKKKTDINLSAWSLVLVDSAPQQCNGYDCGAFTCQFADCASLGIPVTKFSQNDMPYIRKRITLEILDNKLF